MPNANVAVTLDTERLRRVDRLVRDARYPNRGQAIEAATAAQRDRIEGASSPVRPPTHAMA